MSSCRLAIIADDLSGALDSSAPFATHHTDVRVFVSLEAFEETLNNWPQKWPNVIAVNTESRHLEPEEAVVRVCKAVQLLEQLKPQQWFKKVDSTLRGHVVAECRALREALNIPLLLAPAVPAQGRIVRGAEVWVEGVRLADTTYQKDARSTPLTGPIDQAFAAHGLPMQRYCPGVGGSLPNEDCIADTASNEELSALFSLFMSSGVSRVIAGASGLALAMAQHCFGLPQLSFRPLHSVGTVLYAIGSRNPYAAEQLHQLCQWHDLTIVEAYGESYERVPINERISGACVVVPGKATARTASEVAQAMAHQVGTLVSAWKGNDESLLFLTGGDIAMAVLTQMSVRYISVETEWSPGVVLGYRDGDTRRRVMTKAGGFGDPQLLVRLHRQLSALPRLS